MLNVYQEIRYLYIYILMKEKYFYGELCLGLMECGVCEVCCFVVDANGFNLYFSISQKKKPVVFEDFDVGVEIEFFIHFILFLQVITDSYIIRSHSEKSLIQGSFFQGHY